MARAASKLVRDPSARRQRTIEAAFIRRRPRPLLRLPDEPLPDPGAGEPGAGACRRGRPAGTRRSPAGGSLRRPRSGEGVDAFVHDARWRACASRPPRSASPRLHARREDGVHTRRPSTGWGRTVDHGSSSSTSPPGTPRLEAQLDRARRELLSRTAMEYRDARRGGVSTRASATWPTRPGGSPQATPRASWNASAANASQDPSQPERT